MIRVLLALLALAITACASHPKQTEDFLKSPHTLPKKIEIKNVPFIEQSAGFCGPATMTMAMQAAGKSVTLEEIAPQVFTPGMKGSLQTDMITAGRRNGMMAVTIEGLDSLMAEVADGHPVIVFENLALTWLPQWHFALVFGYDLDREVVIMHSGPEKNKNWDMRVFERSWMLGKYWGLVLLQPGQIAKSAGELANTTAAAGLEQSDKLIEAEKSYLRIIEHWPSSLGSLIGLGNIHFRKKRYQESAKYLRKAVKMHPESEAAKHNLSVVEKKL